MCLCVQQGEICIQTLWFFATLYSRYQSKVCAHLLISRFFFILTIFYIEGQFQRHTILLHGDSAFGTGPRCLFYSVLRSLFPAGQQGSVFIHHITLSHNKQEQTIKETDQCNITFSSMIEQVFSICLNIECNHVHELPVCGLEL